MRFLKLATKEKREQFDNYMETIKDKYPSKMYNLFLKSHRFHDYLVLDINYYADTVFFKEKSDKLTLTLQNDIIDEGCLLKIQFDIIHRIMFDSMGENLGEIWDIYFDSNTKDYKGFKIGRIYYSEIGVDENGHFTFELLSEYGFKLYIVFDKCKLLENKLLRY